MQKITKRLRGHVSREEWASLKYPFTIEPISEEEGGGWTASIPMLGAAMFVGDGDTPAEALADLEARRLKLFDKLAASGRPIPVPVYEEEEAEEALPSGRFLVRTTPALHASLQAAAASQGVSLNQYCCQLLERGATADSLSSYIEGALQGAVRELSAIPAQVSSQIRASFGVINRPTVVSPASAIVSFVQEERGTYNIIPTESVVTH